MTQQHDSIRNGLTSWLSAHWPNATELNLSNLRSPDVGASSQTVFFDVKWLEKGESKNLSLAAHLKPIPQSQVFPDCDLEREYRILILLEDAPVATPRMFGYEPDASVAGSPFYLMERIDGRLFVENPPYHIQGWVADSTPEERAHMWYSAIDAFSSIHKIDLKTFDFGFLDHPEWVNNPLDQQLRYWKEYRRWVLKESESHPLCEEALTWLEANKPSGPQPVALCWGDAKVGNMVFQETRCAGLLDWESAHLGNPLEDVVWYTILDRILSEGISFPRLEGFPDRKETLRYWEEPVDSKPTMSSTMKCLAH